jgi:hypothetical protein
VREIRRMFWQHEQERTISKNAKASEMGDEKESQDKP